MLSLIKNIVIFNRLYKAKNFRDVSEELDISITTISRSMSELENLAETTLFLRSSNKFEPTQSGHDFFLRTSEVVNELTMLCDKIKDNNHVIKMLIPQQMSNELMVRIVYDYKLENNVPLNLHEICDMPSRTLAYEQLVQGRLDLMIDTEPNNSNSFISIPINSISLYLIGNRDYYKNLKFETITPTSQFVKGVWLGSKGESLEKSLGIKAEHQVGYVTQNLRNYFQVVSSTDFLGLCPNYFREHLSARCVFSEEPITDLTLYFITTKSNMYHRPGLSWLKDKILKLGIEFSTQDL